MVDYIGNLFFIFFGLFITIFHKALARLAVEWQYKLFHIKYTETTIKFTGIGFLLVGAVFIILSMLNLLGIHK